MKCLRHRSVPDHNVGLNPIRLKACHQYFCHFLRGKRVQEDINNFWMGHAPETMSETYSRLDLELDLRVAEAESMGVGFTVPLVPIAPSCSKISEESDVELVLQL